MSDVVLEPRDLAPRLVPADVWRRATDAAVRTGAISEWFASRLREPREIDLLPFDAARIGAALADDPDAELADVGRYLVSVDGPVACTPRALAEERAAAEAAALAAALAPPEPAPAPAAPVAATPRATVVPLSGASVPAAPVPAPPAPPTPTAPSRVKRALGPLGALLFLLLKFAAKLKIALVLLGKGKFAATALSSVLSVGLYALFWGWRFAVLFVALLVVHELGHVLVARREGVPVSMPMLIPFMGAVVAMREAPKNAWSEAKIALGGPVVGTIGAAALLAVAEQLDSDLLRAAAYTGFLLNLFNLLPITPLDGGRAAAALHPAVWFVGAAGLIALLAYFPSPLLIIIAFFGLMDAWRRYRAFRTGGEEARRYYAVRAWQRVVVAGVYFSLAALLVLGMGAAHVIV